MNRSETDRLNEILKNLNQGKSLFGDQARRHVYDRDSRQFRPASPNDDPDRVMDVTRHDMGWGVSTPPKIPWVIVPEEILLDYVRTGQRYPVRMSKCDEGEAYTFVDETTVLGTVAAMLCRAEPGETFEAVRRSAANEEVCVVCNTPVTESQIAPCDLSASSAAYVRWGETWHEGHLVIVPIREHLFSRHKGIFETGVLSSSTVMVAGIGSIGSKVALGLVEAGVMDFILLDHDRLEVANVCRHAAPLSHVGRFKTKSVAELLRGKNPYCSVETREVAVTWDSTEAVRTAVRNSDIVVCGLDSHEGRLIINRLCLEENTPCVFAGMRRRAYGGQVLVLRPGQGPCYQCYVMMSPDSKTDREIATLGQRGSVPYSDIEVAVEPGLSNDVAPVNAMVVKLVIQYLLKGRDTTLRSLDEDLTAALYLWLNRREGDSPFANLEPLGTGVTDMAILRWYGLPADRNPACPDCGDFVAYASRSMGIEIPQSRTMAFESETPETGDPYNESRG